MKKILIGVDGSEGSKKAIQYIVDWLNDAAMQVKVTVMTVQEPIPTYVSSELTAQNLDPWAIAERNAEEMIEEVARPLAEANIAYDTLVTMGDAGSEICLAAKQNDADLIIVGRRGRNTFAEIVLGSVSHRVLHHAPCPVLVVG